MQQRQSAKVLVGIEYKTNVRKALEKKRNLTSLKLICVIFAGESARLKLFGEIVLAVEALICDFAVIVFLSRICHLPVRGTELYDLQQQELREGAEPLLQEKTISEKGEEFIHWLGIHLLQLFSNAVQLQHQAVHLLLLPQAIRLRQSEQAFINWVHQRHHGHVVHPQVVKDVTDEGDVTDPRLG